jgi:hypothetical protein
MVDNSFERLGVSYIKSDDINKQRIFQKIFFGKENLFDNDFFDQDGIADTDIYFIQVKQLDNNTRAVILGGYLYKFNPDNPLYNYLDNGRAIYYSSDICFIFNDLDIKREDLSIVNIWQHKKHKEITFKQIWDIHETKRYGNQDTKVYLLFKDDIERIKAEVLREEEESRLEKTRQNKERAEQEKLDKKKEKEISEMKKSFMTLPKIEDRDIIIENNYFIEKNKGLKIVFDKKIVNIFDKDDLFSDYGNSDDTFIRLDYRNF